VQFKDIPGQETLKKQLIDAVQNNRVAHAQLFLGPKGSPNLAMALAYGQFLNCHQPSESDSCGSCSSCKKMARFIHPDVYFSFPTIGTGSMSAELIPKWREILDKTAYFSEYQWMRFINSENKIGNITKKESVQIVKNLSLKVLQGNYKIQYIWKAEKLEKSGTGNVLLKTIEEPPEKTIILMVANEEDKLLGTIRSRTQYQRIKPFTEEEMALYLEHKYQVEPQKAISIAQVADGDVEKAEEFLQEEENPTAQQLETWLSLCLTNNVASLHKWVEEIAGIGREAQKKLIKYMLYFIRQSFLLKTGQKQTLTGVEKKMAVQFVENWEVGQFERVTSLLNKSHYYIERNVYPKLLFFNLSIQFVRMMSHK